jgi:hypothetical protein
METTYLSNNGVQITNEWVKVGDQAYKTAEIKSATVRPRWPHQIYRYWSWTILLAGSVFVLLTLSLETGYAKSYFYVAGYPIEYSAALFFASFVPTVPLLFTSRRMASLVKKYWFAAQVKGTFGTVDVAVSEDKK